MAFNLKQCLCGGKTFCCCLPVRFGVLAMTFISMLVTGVLVVVIWFKTSRHDMAGQGRTVLILVGIVETLLFVASILGFAGAVVRKLLFVVIYAYFVYGHFVLNVIVAIYVLWVVGHAARTDIVKACDVAIQDPSAEAQCKSLFRVTVGVFAGVAALVLFIELYGALIVTRYANQLRSEKATLRESRLSAARQSRAFQLMRVKGEGGGYDRLSDSYAYNEEAVGPYGRRRAGSDPEGPRVVHEPEGADERQELVSGGDEDQNAEEVSGHESFVSVHSRPGELYGV